MSTQHIIDATRFNDLLERGKIDEILQSREVFRIAGYIAASQIYDNSAYYPIQIVYKDGKLTKISEDFGNLDIELENIRRVLSSAKKNNLVSQAFTILSEKNYIFPGNNSVYRVTERINTAVIEFRHEVIQDILMELGRVLRFPFDSTSAIVLVQYESWKSGVPGDVAKYNATVVTYKITYWPIPLADIPPAPTFVDLYPSQRGGLFCDLTLQTSEVPIMIHKIVLYTAGGEIFQIMLKSGMKESITSVIDLSQHPPKVIQAFVEFLYTGNVVYDVALDIWEMYEFSKMYNIENLTTVVQNLFIKHASSENKKTLTEYSERYNDKRLLQLAQAL